MQMKLSFFPLSLILRNILPAVNPYLFPPGTFNLQSVLID